MRLIPTLAAAVLTCGPAPADTPAPAPPPRPVEFAVVESSLPTAGGNIRQFAFDADPATYFASTRNPTTADHLTLRFDNPVSLKSLAVVTGRPGGADALAAGVLEASIDGTEFVVLSTFDRGNAEATANGMAATAIRIRPSEDLNHPLVIREIAIDSDPKVATFRYPIEITLDVSDAPEMREWGEKVIRVCERQYPMICDELASDGYSPPTQIRMVLRNDYKGVAAAGGGRITGSVRYFKSRPEDIGAMVHETVHCVQNYRARGLPGWLVEGIADYIRFWKYEPGKAGRLNPERARYDGSYRVTAAFLAYVSEKYDPKLVNKLNAQLRAGKYNPAVWEQLTGKTVEELNQEWRQSLAK
jgi:hypothetical protein